MANKKRRRRPRSGPAGGGPRPNAGQRATERAKERGAGGDGGGERGSSGGARPHQQTRPRADRQARKQQAREAREAAIRARRRRESIRRFVIAVVVAGVVVGGFLFLTRAGGPNPFPQAATDAAAAAGCSDLQTPADSAPGGNHLESGATYAYPEEPATSGPHAPGALSGTAVYEEMPDETALVHNLEHAFVNIYYRPDGDTALPQDVVDQLATIAQNDPKDHVILSPHTSLPDGTDLAVTAWNKLMTCPSTVTADQATAIARGFVTAFQCTSNAPEPKASGGC